MNWTAGDKKSDIKKGDSSKLVELRPENKEKQDAANLNHGNRDLSSGMEVLELDFLLSVVESTQSHDSNDVTMRKLDFNELIRRGLLNEIDSDAIKVYAKDENKFYGREIQCAAMKELTIRTENKN